MRFRPELSIMSRLLERFLRYVQVDTTAREGAQAYPSSPGQLELGRMLLDELLTLGWQANQDKHGLVLASLPGNVPRELPAIVFNAHLDTSPETTGAGVRPQVWPNYNGQNLVLPGDPTKVLRVADNPEMASLVGCTLITTDGTTLLGADDKAGVAVIMEAAARLCEAPEHVHGPVRLLFTCDEEIGRGIDYVDVQALQAVACYTLDGHGTGEIDVETFSADLAVVTVRGVNIHPSIAKGRMINAVRAAADFLARLPRDRLAPECAEGREGFLHPYHIGGGVAEVVVRILLRDFETAALADHAALLEAAAQATRAAWPGCEVFVEIRPQYRNMREGLAREPRAVAYAEEAMRRVGRTPRRTIVRGGTDGSRLTELGLPTPNLSTGEHNPHSVLEWTCLEEMEEAVRVVLALCAVWAEGAEP
jgi:tripeptide aminopeptidase